MIFYVRLLTGARSGNIPGMVLDTAPSTHQTLGQVDDNDFLCKDWFGLVEKTGKDTFHCCEMHDFDFDVFFFFPSEGCTETT